MSKLAALAKKRAHNASTGDNKNVDILNRLTSDKDPDPSLSSVRRSNILKQRNRIREPEPCLPTKPEIQRPKEAESETPLDSDTEPNPFELQWNVSFDNSLITASKVFFIDGSEPKKRRRLDDDIYKLITNKDLPIETVKTAEQNFKTESPDDKVQNAQKQAFNDFKKLDITDSLPKQTIKVNPDDLKSNPLFQKPHKSFVVIGHVDAGKSTLMGRMLLDLNVVDLKTVNKLIKESENIGKGSFALAWLMDQTSEERSRGVTVDIVATNFETSKTRFTAIDAPGHRDFVPQMINGVCQADLALLIVDSITGEFESGFQLDGQTKEHTLIARNLGIQKICCIINKLDKEEWSELRFDYIKNQLLDYLVNDIGFTEGNIEFIPLSGLTGNNVIKRQSMPQFEWYQGPTLLEYLDNVNAGEDVDESVQRLFTEPFNLVINDILDVSNQEFCVVGKILSGLIQTNDSLKCLPLNETLKVTKLKYNGKAINYSISGEIVELYFLKKTFKEKFDELSAGDILTNSDKVKSVSKFECKLNLFNLTKPLLVGTPFVLFRNNLNVPAKLSGIISIDDGKKKKKKHLISNQDATVEITVDSDRLLPISKFEDSQLLGKVVIRKEGVTIGAGTVLNL